jgi:hypothetical protein
VGMNSPGSGNNGVVHRRPIESSVLAEVGYDQKRRILEVKLVSGAIYQYLDVPAREFMALLAAESAGRYYNTTIKPAYDYRQL